MRRGLVLLLLVALLAPGVRAGAAVAGSLEWGDDATLTGEAAARARDGLLDLSGAAEGLVASWSSARGYRVEAEEYGGPFGPGWRPDPRNETIAWGAGSLSIASCAACVVLASADGAGDGAVGLAGRADGPMLGTQGRRWQAGAVGGASVTYRVPEPWLQPPPMRDARPFAEGRVTLYVWGAEARVEDGDGGARVVWTGKRAEPLAGPAPATRTRSAFLVLELSDASLDGPPGGRLAGPALDVEVRGVVRAPAATGWLSLDGARRDLAADALTLEGTLRVAASPLALAGQGATLGGDAERVVVSGDTLRGPAPLASGVAPAVAGGGLLALLVAARFLWPLYSRLRRADVLRNANRARVYEAVRAEPGAHVADLARRTGIGRVVLQHHLRMLEAHSLVVARRGGKLLTYFAADRVPPRDLLAAHDALRDPARRAVAAAIAGEPAGLTQRELEERLSLSRRLVSYHVAKLEAAGCARREGFLPARFLAEPSLRDALAPETVRIRAATDGMET